jgi:hypothetical protein
MPRFIALLAGALLVGSLALPATASAGALDATTTPVGGVEPGAAILSSMPAFSTALPQVSLQANHTDSGTGAAAGTGGSDGVSNATVRLLLSPPPPDADRDD